jgi:signal transduction histidine kinase
VLGSAATQSLPMREDSDESFDAARYALAARLMESLLHDARNPLNALSINLEVLQEKLKLQAGGAVPPSQEKNLKSMRDQITRVDQILRLFAPFIAQSGPDEELRLSESVTHALEVLGHEGRRARVRFKASIEPELRLTRVDGGAVRFLFSTLVLQTLERCRPGGELVIELSRQKGRAVLAVFAQGEAAELSVPPTLCQAAARAGAEVSPVAGGFRAELPLG